jgi:DNA-binding NarL/FixJ family response regulator
MDTLSKSLIKPGIVLRPGRRPGLDQAGFASRVWLVDDDRELRHLLAELLGRAGGFGRPREFHSPDTLLAALGREAPPDAILLDVQLGDKNGLDYIKPIKALAPRTRVFVLTTLYDANRESRAFAEGASGFLLKSESIESIIAQLQPVHASPKWALGVTLGVERLNQTIDGSAASAQSFQE